jgi:hypothetical protein
MMRALALTMTVALAAGGFLLYRLQTPAASAGVQGDDLARMQQELEQLKSDVRRKPQLIPVPVSPAAPAAAAEAASRTASPPAPPPTEAEVLAHLGSSFSREPTDPRWSGEAATQARTALATRLTAGSAIQKVECKSTLCRMEISHLDLDSFRQSVRSTFLAPDNGLWNGAWMAAVVDTDNGVRAVAYLARPGADLPIPEPTAAD